MYDYRLDDAGISNLKEDDEDEERKVNDTFCHTDLNATKNIFILFSHLFACTVGPVGHLDGICKECCDHPRNKLC